jgi:hypothetical protein
MRVVRLATGVLLMALAAALALAGVVSIVGGNSGGGDLPLPTGGAVIGVVSLVLALYLVLIGWRLVRRRRPPAHDD